jgi:hypothetical protein
VGQGRAGLGARRGQIVVEQHLGGEAPGHAEHRLRGGRRVRTAQGDQTVQPSMLQLGVAGEGAEQNRPGNKVAIADQKALQHRAAERPADRHYRPEAQVADQAGGIVRHLINGVGPGRDVAASGPAVVEGDAGEARCQQRLDARPGAGIGAQARDEQQRGALALDVVVQIDVVDRCRGHVRFPRDPIRYVLATAFRLTPGGSGMSSGIM